ncbi:hypothetical protein MTO96_033216 [Rhipicephalus appendiculatus]
MHSVSRKGFDAARGVYGLQLHRVLRARARASAVDAARVPGRALLVRLAVVGDARVHHALSCLHLVVEQVDALEDVDLLERGQLEHVADEDGGNHDLDALVVYGLDLGLVYLEQDAVVERPRDRRVRVVADEALQLQRVVGGEHDVRGPDLDLYPTPWGVRRPPPSGRCSR